MSNEFTDWKVDKAVDEAMVKVQNLKDQGVDLSEDEISKIIAAEKNRQLNEFSIMHYRQIENRSYVKKL